MNNLNTLQSNYITQHTLSESQRNAVICLITASALTAIGALSVGLLSQCALISGINSIGQSTLIASGSAIGLTSIIAGVFYYHTLRKAAQDLSELSIDELEQKITEIMNGQGDLIRALHKLAEAIPLETLEKLVKNKFKDFPGALSSVNNMARGAKAYLEAREEFSPSFKARAQKVLDTLFVVLDSLFEAFGIAEFFEKSETKFDGEFKFQKVMMLISLFTLLTATLLPLLGVTTGASVVGGTILLIAVMSIVWRQIRPLPTRIPEAENWSKQMSEGKLGKPKGRKRALDSIAKALTNHQHPLLIGSSGVGKTQTVKAFVKALERGDYPELKGKKVFYFNTADLVGKEDMFSGGNDILKQISKALGRHRKNCILVFDEIHLAYKEGKNATPIGEQLKTFLDDKQDNFPHVIGLTTEEEYYRDIYKDNSAGDRRFEKIAIESTDAKATKGILSQYIIEKAPGALVESGALEYLIEKTKTKTLPLAAIKLLSRCIEKTERIRELPNAKKNELNSEELEGEYFTGAMLGSSGLKSDSTRSDNISKLEKTRDELKEDLKKDKTLLQNLERTRKNLVKARETKFKRIVQAEKQDLLAKEKSELKEFLLLKYFCEEALENQLLDAASDLDISVVINKDLIDQVLKDEEANLQKRSDFLKRGKEQLHERL